MDEHTPPKVELGQVVLWSQDGGASGTPAIVTKVGTKTLSLAVIAESYTNFLTRSGVRHVSDPDRKRGSNAEDGLWDLTARDKRINSVLEGLEEV